MVETQLNLKKKIRKSDSENGLYLAFDISTSCIGFSIFNSDGILLDIRYIKMTTDKDVEVQNRYIAKANLFKEFIQEYKQYKIYKVIIEDPLVASNNVNTVNTLLRFNGICSYLIYQELSIIPEYLTVSEVRQLFCPEMCEFNKKTNKMVLKFKSKGIDPKEYIQQKVSNLEPDLNWTYTKNNTLKTENFDMSDSYALGKAYFIKTNLI